MRLNLGTILQAVEPLNLRATRQADGIVIEWQTPLSSASSAFSVYYSQDGQWENAALVTAPLFSSVNSESALVSYSLLDENVTAPPTCAYWVLGTEDGGIQHAFGPISVQERFGLYLPIVHWQ